MEKRADIIKTDFPWLDCYGKRINTKTKFGGGAQKYYQGMTNQEILNFKTEIDKVAEKDCMLLQWATMPTLDFAIEAMEHFGFTYKTVAMVWVKVAKNGEPRILPSYYFGSNIEVLLLGIKGKNRRKFEPAIKLLGQVVEAPLREHSRKPDEVFERINLAYPDLTKVEFFSRQHREGWTCFGNEVGKFDTDIS